jgi:hypothetical protein
VRGGERESIDVLEGVRWIKVTSEDGRERV